MTCDYNVMQHSQNVKIYAFLSINTEGQSPSCPTTKNLDEKFKRVARPRNRLWFNSYLENRKQFVAIHHINGVEFELGSASYRVPQGSASLLRKIITIFNLYL